MAFKKIFIFLKTIFQHFIPLINWTFLDINDTTLLPVASMEMLVLK